MRLCILCQCIMYVIGTNQIDSRLSVHLQKLLINILLFRYPMILQFQKKVSFSKNILITKSCCLCILIHPSGKKSGYFTCQAGTQSNEPFMIFLKEFQIHPGFIIKSLYKSFGYDFHQITVAPVVLCKKNQMIITVFSTSRFTLKSGSRCHINFAAQNRIDACCLCGPVKINNPIHNTMICNGCTVHTKLFYSFYIFFYLVGSIQKTVFCMNMKMCKIHNLILYLFTR